MLSRAQSTFTQPGATLRHESPGYTIDAVTAMAYAAAATARPAQDHGGPITPTTYLRAI